MTKRDLAVTALLALVALAAVAAETATAKGVGMGAFEGVTAPGSEHRYIAISPHIPGKITVVARIEREDARLRRSWYLRGRYQVPAVAYDFSPGGLAADGRTLVLSRVNDAYTPRTTRFAVLDTQRAFRWEGRGRPPRFRRFFDYIDLRGDFSFDAISPDGSTLYLIQRYLPPSSGGAYISNYKVRAVDLESGELLPQPIVDPEEPDERMAGLPITRVSSPDGRWAYTLYDGDDKDPFVHALDTVGRRAVCIDLPQLEGRKLDGRKLNAFNLRLRVDDRGRLLTVMSGPPPPRELPTLAEGRPVSSPTPRPLLSIDTDGFEVERPRLEESGVGSAVPWGPIAIGSVLFAAVLIRATRRRRSGSTA
jgi:hypothetical protein